MRDSAVIDSHSQEHILEQRTSRGEGRLFQLDALRGLAAVAVVTYHFRILAFNTPLNWRTRIFFSGQEAVILFFLLSGYVLSLPYWGTKSRSYLSYAIRRVCRIYIPFAAAATLSIAGAHLFRFQNLPLNHFYYTTWQTSITSAVVVKQFLMWPFQDFNIAFWSLRYEMQLSLLVPLFCYLLRFRTSGRLFILCCIAVFLRPSIYAHIEWHMVGRTITILPMFIFGAILAQHRLRLRQVLTQLGFWRWLLLGVSVAFYLQYPIDRCMARCRGFSEDVESF